MTYSPPERGSFVRAVKDLRDALRDGRPLPQPPAVAAPDIAPSQWDGTGYSAADEARINAAGRDYRAWRDGGFYVKPVEHPPVPGACPVHDVNWSGPGVCWADGKRCGPAVQGPAGNAIETEN